MKSAVLRPFFLFLAISWMVVISACSLAPPHVGGQDEPEILTVYPDGSMKLMGRPIPVGDVYIYADGFGGEKAAVKVRIEPLHPDFYRDTIIVRRIAGEFEPEAGAPSDAN